jgi:hypothetical protein
MAVIIRVTVTAVTEIVRLLAINRPYGTESQAVM